MNRDPRIFWRRHSRQHAAFSLVELVMVVVIISIIAAIAVPRVSHAAKNSQSESIRATIANVGRAIDLFNAEHGRYPGYNPANGTPDGEWFVKQLTQYSDASGDAQTTPGGDFIYGPYLQKPFPTNPYNGLNTVQVKAGASGAIALDSSGWIARLSDGEFTINTDTNVLSKEVFAAEDIAAIDSLRQGN